MMTKKTIVMLQKAAITATSFLLGIIILTTVICFENSSQVSAALGSDTFKIIQATSDVDTDTEYYKSSYTTIADLLDDSEKTASNIMAEGAVLLKNESEALPLAQGERSVSLFGITSAEPVYGGTGSGGTNTSTATNFENAFRAAGFTLNETLLTRYKSTWFNNTYRRSSGGYGGQNGMYIRDVPWNVVNSAASSSFSQFSDAAIFIIGRVGGEGGDLSMTNAPDGINGNYLQLNANEISVLEGLAALRSSNTFKRLIVIINSASPLEADFIENPAYKIDSALWIGTAGSHGLKAVGKILSGEIVPSGKLSDTFWAKHSQNPVHANYGGFLYENAADFVSVTKGNQYVPEETLGAYVVYQEGIYVGYRYTETRYEDYVLNTPKTGEFDYSATVTYPFGYGQSYTQFAYSDLQINKTDDKTYQVTIKVTNTGNKFSGKESVQIYLQKPYGEYDIRNEIEKASVELVAFSKTQVLAPGASETLKIDVNERFFAAYDAREAKTYVLTAGDYYLCAASNAHDAINNILAAKGYSPSSTQNRMDSLGDAALVKKFTLGFNKDKYSWAEATDIKITNLFDFADINLYSGRESNSVGYTTRNNWTSSVSFGSDDYARLYMTRQMADEIHMQAPEEYKDKLDTHPIQKDNIAYPQYGKNSGTLMLVDMRTDSEGNKLDYNDLAWDTFMDQLTWDEIVSIISDGYHTTVAVESIAKPATKDENGPNGFKNQFTHGSMGLATKYNDPDKNKYMTAFPANGLLAATFNLELAEKTGEMLGEEALWSGHSGIYALGLNIHRSPYLGRTCEYYSEDGILSGLIGAQEVIGIQSRGCNVYNKHSVLNDQEAYRHGVGVWLPEQALREIYLRAFELPIVLGGAMNTMAAFNRLGTISGPACGALAEGFLRGECGMQGMVITDMYTDMDGSQGNDPYFEFAYGIYTRGCDLPDGYNLGYQFDTYKEGYGRMAWAMRDAAKRVLFSVAHSNAMNGFSSDTRIVKIMPDWQIMLIVANCIVGVLFLVSVAWGTIGLYKYRSNRT